jgi:short chain dehydrogenase
MDLKSAVAVVTGGNGGLGQRVCHAPAKEGVHIAVIYAQSRDEAEAVARELTSRHKINAAAFACDVTNGAAVQGLIGDVTVRFGRLDVLVKRCRLQQVDSLHGSRQSYPRGVEQDPGHQSNGANEPHQGGGTRHEGARAGPHCQHRVGSRARANPLRTPCRRRVSFTSRAAWLWRWRRRRSSTVSRPDCWKARARRPISGPSRSSAPHQDRS